MKRYFDLSLILAVLLVLLAACGQPARVGTEETLDFDEQAQQGRLGQRASPEPEPTDAGEGALGRAESPTPEPSPSPTPKKFFDIYLTTDSPWYEAEGPGLPRQEATEWNVAAGFTLRVTNEDTCDCRPERRFVADDGTFGSEPLTLGEVYILELTVVGEWLISDPCCPFLTRTAMLRVTP